MLNQKFIKKYKIKNSKKKIAIINIKGGIVCLTNVVNAVRKIIKQLCLIFYLQNKDSNLFIDNNKIQ